MINSILFTLLYVPKASYLNSWAAEVFIRDKCGIYENLRIIFMEKLHIYARSRLYLFYYHILYCVKGSCEKFDYFWIARGLWQTNRTASY